MYCLGYTNAIIIVDSFPNNSVKTMKKFICLLFVIPISACTDSAKGVLGAYGDSAKIKCYSAGQEIYSGMSSGKVKLSKGGFIKFSEKGTGKYIEIAADCVVQYE